MFEIVKMTHVCQYWRSTLISYPRLWSSIFVKNDHKDFIAACLERSQEAPLTVHLDLTHGDYERYPDCTCTRNEWSAGMWTDERNPCRYHTTIYPLLEIDDTRRIRTLDVHLDMLDDVAEEGPDQHFKGALNDFGLCELSLPALESLSIHVGYDFDANAHLGLPTDLFCWESSPPTKLRHLALHGCYGGPVQAICNLTSLELAGGGCAFDPIELDQFTFLPFISCNRSLVSLALLHCDFPDPAQLSQARVTPVKLPELKSLRLTDSYGLSGFPGLVDVPAFKSLSSLRISVRSDVFGSLDTKTLAHVESDDGFQLFYDSPDEADVVSDWHGAVYGADPSLTFIRFEGREPESTVRDEMEAFPPSLFVKADVLEIGVSFADLGYDFWEDLEQVGPQLATLRLEVTEEMRPTIANSVEKFVEARFNKGMPLEKLERMRFEEMSEEDEETAEKLWAEFRAGLNIDQYLSPR